MRYGFSKIVWGGFLLFAAALVVINQLDGFTASIGIGSVAVAILALAIIVHCLINLNFALLPVPLAMLYIVFHGAAGLPFIPMWALILASVLAWIGLGILLPSKHWYSGVFRNCRGKRNGKMDTGASSTGTRTEKCYGGNNPEITVNFGAVSRRIHADCLESVQLNCNFGAIEAIFDEAELHSSGAQASLTCSFGAIKLVIPKHWRVIDNIDCILGGVEIGKRAAIPADTAPQLTLTGNVSMGGIEVKYV